MKRSVLLCQVALVGMIGCSGPTAPVSTSPESVVSTPSSNEEGAAVTFVSLKVPNMH